MTEDEAKEKWCPHVRMWSVRSDHSSSGGWNRHPFDNPDNPDGKPAGANCLGSGCMAWRWDDPQSIDAPISDVDHGHCGLAGKP